MSGKDPGPQPNQGDCRSPDSAICQSRKRPSRFSSEKLPILTNSALPATAMTSTTTKTPAAAVQTAVGEDVQPPRRSSTLTIRQPTIEAPNPARETDIRIPPNRNNDAARQ